MYQSASAEQEVKHKLDFQVTKISCCKNWKDDTMKPNTVLWFQKKEQTGVFSVIRQICQLMFQFYSSRRCSGFNTALQPWKLQFFNHQNIEKFGFFAAFSYLTTTT